MKKIKLLSIIVASMMFMVACQPTNVESPNTSTGSTSTTSSAETNTDSKQDETSETNETNTNSSNTENKSNETSTTTVEVKNVEKNNQTETTVDTTKSSSTQLNNDFTSKMLEDIKDYSITLVEGDNLTYDNFPKENLQAIAKYDTPSEFGWVVRYGVNKVAIARYYKESTTNVIVMFNSALSLENVKTLLVNDTPEELKDVAEKLIQKEISGEATIEYAY